MVPETAFLDPAWLGAHPRLVTRLAYMWLLGFTTRCKYYFVWTWAHAACMASGASWAGWTSSCGAEGRMVPDWSRASNIDILGVELATSAASYPVVWNTRTGRWLRHYCYERLAPPHKGRGPFWALFITQAVSGLWHGVQPGYFLFFGGSSFMLHASKVLFRHQRGLAPGAKTKAANLVHGLLASFHLNYLAVVFIAITLPAGWAAWKATHFVGLASMVAICVIGELLPAPRAPGGKKGAANGGVSTSANGTCANGNGNSGHVVQANGRAVRRTRKLA
jgi:lysophospholipid acyltransferase